jgi:hypothetical protein
MEHLASLYTEAQRFGEAEGLWKEVIALWTQSQGADGYRTFKAKEELVKLQNRGGIGTD